MNETFIEKSRISFSSEQSSTVHEKNIWKQVIVDKIVPSASGVYGETVTHCIGLEIVTMSDLFRTKCQLVTFCIE